MRICLHGFHGIVIFAAYFLLALSTLLPPTLSLAATPQGFTSGYPTVKPLTPKDVPEERKPVRLYKLNEADLFTGDYRYEIEIPTPPGLGGLTPSVLLIYRSGGLRTQLGAGWDLNYDYIRRTTRRGVPKYTSLTDGGKNQDELEFKIGEDEGILVFVEATSDGYLYRPKREGSFLKFYYHPNTRPSGSVWRVYDPNGIRRELGNGNDKELNPSNDRPYIWLISNITDPDSNRINYQWDTLVTQQFSGIKLLSGITYNWFAWGPDKNTLVKFNWNYNREGHSEEWFSLFTQLVFHHPFPDYSSGYGRRVHTDYQLNSIDVYNYDETGTDAIRRSFFIKYARTRKLTDTSSNVGFGSPNLVSVEPELLPKTEFEYTQPPKEFSAKVFISDSNPNSSQVEERTLFASRFRYQVSDLHTNSEARMTNMLTDMDGDGDLDQLYVKKARLPWQKTLWFWRENEDGFSFGKKHEIQPPKGIPEPEALTYEKNTRQPDSSAPTGFTESGVRIQNVMDMNGDGRADIVYQNSQGIYVCTSIYMDAGAMLEGRILFQPCVRWLGLTGDRLQRLYRFNSRQDGRGRAYTWEDTDLIDMNGDGLPDLVEARDDEEGLTNENTKNVLAVYLNQGSGFSVEPEVRIDTSPCSEIAHSTIGLNRPPACIRSSFTSDAHNLTCGTRDLIDINADGLVDLVKHYAEIGERKDATRYWAEHKFYCAPRNQLQSHASGLDVYFGSGVVSLLVESLMFLGDPYLPRLTRHMVQLQMASL